jgi:hypothetical protein
MLAGDPKLTVEIGIAAGHAVGHLTWDHAAAAFCEVVEKTF